MKYLVDTKHARNVAAWEKVNHTFQVREDHDGRYYVDATDFGMSRPYKTNGPQSAIRLFLAEHACTPHNIREI